MKWETRNLNELPKFRDGLSYVYLEHCRVEQDDSSIAALTPDGVVAIPVSALGVLLLGPGTTVTHAAIKALAQNGCSVQWVGEDAARYYAAGTGETRSSERLLRQAKACVDDGQHLEVVRRLYTLRFAEALDPRLTLQQIRGREGVRVRDAYANASKASGIPWHGRQYQRDNWNASDPINRAISSGNACLYGISHAAIVSAGYSPALGFIHVGKQLSFVYDVADIYKVETVIPMAFETVADLPDNLERAMRTKLRQCFKDTRLLERIVEDINNLFTKLEDIPDLYAEDAARPGDLWDVDGAVEGGVDYGGDQPRKSP
jgi:CRISP-associated protein Cas1